MLVSKTSPADGPIQQGEIIGNIRVFVPEPGYHDEKWLCSGRVELYPFTFVLSQDCDLEQDYFARKGELGRSANNLLISILLCEARPADEVLSKLKDQGSKVREYIVQNKHERYHYVSTVPADSDAMGTGISALILDFKHYLTIPAADLYAQIVSSARRRSILQPSYLEHLSTRFCYYQYRVALPQDHHRIDEDRKRQSRQADHPVSNL